ncbi:hypothetical protein ABZ816_39425 [Actinosynnema sp. NPDC047251]|uniref:hypothetical protein n=1 Tax=Saccharothrix espanaensis TaxID=103731 RepID=UPI00030D55A5|nr:hypothetical protein [Saccharothrix espanaensis]
MGRKLWKPVLGSLLALGLTVSGGGIASAGVGEAKVSGQDAALTKVRITFHTLDDDKDHDTCLDVNVTDNTGRQIGHLDQDFCPDQFPDGDVDGPFTLTLLAGATWESMRNGQVTVRVSPDGNDHWNLAFYTVLLFSDGDRRNANYTGQASHINREVHAEVV